MFKLTNDQRRIYLEFTVRIMLLIAVLSLTAVFLASLFRSNPELDDVKVFSLADLKYGQARLLDWHGKKLWLLKRRSYQVAGLRDLDNKVKDEWSKLKPLPKGMNYLHRGLLSEYVLLFAYGDQCQVEVVEGDVAVAFYEPCTQLQYDIAGRVFKSSDASGVAEHLRVPAYRIVGAKLLVGDEPR